MIISRANILIVDDEPLVLDMFQRSLELDNFKVLTASTAKEAIKILGSRDVDVFICDVLLPDSDGFHLLNLAKNRDEDIQVLLITAAPNPIDKARATAMGAKYFSKPISLNELKLAIYDCLASLAKFNNRAVA
jgi:DNA-binding response OmpR family regulator